MALNTADQLRLAMNDRPRLGIEVYEGDGSASSYLISGSPVISGATALGGMNPSAYLPAAGGGGWSGTAATFNYPLGMVSFATAGLPAGTSFRVQYTYASFSDQEIDHITANYSTLPQMKLRMIDTLMGDAYRRARWAGPGGTFYDDTQAMSNLLKLRSAVYNEMTTESGPLADVVGWSTEQENN